MLASVNENWLGNLFFLCLSQLFCRSWFFSTFFDTQRMSRQAIIISKAGGNEFEVEKRIYGKFSWHKCNFPAYFCKVMTIINLPFEQTWTESKSTDCNASHSQQHRWNRSNDGCFTPWSIRQDYEILNGIKSYWIKWFIFFFLNLTNRLTRVVRTVLTGLMSSLLPCCCMLEKHFSNSWEKFTL